MAKENVMLYLIFIAGYSVCSLGVLAGLAMAAIGSIIRKKKFAIESVPLLADAGLGSGLVALEGLAEPLDGKILRAPLSETDCLYFECTAQRQTVGGLKLGEKHVHSEQNPFILKMKSGEALIDPRGAKNAIKTTYNLAFSENHPHKIQEFLDAEKLHLHGEVYYEEHVIQPDDELFIIGSASSGSGGMGLEDASTRTISGASLNAGDFRIWNKSRNEILKGFRLWELICFHGGIAVAAGSAMGLVLLRMIH